jgi:hypothetical protein
MEARPPWWDASGWERMAGLVGGEHPRKEPFEQLVNIAIRTFYI